MLNSIVFLRRRTPLRYFASKELGLGAASAGLSSFVASRRRRRRRASPPPRCTDHVALQSHCIVIALHCNRIVLHCNRIALHCVALHCNRIALQSRCIEIALH